MKRYLNCEAIIKFFIKDRIFRLLDDRLNEVDRVELKSEFKLELN